MLKHKLWRDLLKNKMQFISIFLMSFLGLMVFVGLDAEGNGLGSSASSYYEETNLADLWVMGKTFTSEDVKQISQIAGINHASRRLQLSGTANLDNNPYMELNFIEENEVSRLFIKSGVEFNAQEEGIWLDELFAKEQKLDVGDTITIEFNGLRITEEIKGLIIHPEYVFYLADEGAMMPDYGAYGYGFLSGKEFPVQEQLVYNQIIVDMDKQQDITRMKDSIKAALDSKDLVVTDRKQDLSYATFDGEKEQHIMMGFLFPVVFLLIAILGIVTTMTRMTANQRIQIGTLKALGFTKNTITNHYMSYGFFISLVGGITGACVGWLYLPLLFRANMMEAYILPVWKTTVSNNSYLAIIINVLVSTLVSYLACRRELRDPPAITLKPPVPKKSKPTFIETSKIWDQLSFSVKWNYRDMIRNKMRTLMGVVGVIGCTMLMVCAFGMKDSVGDMAYWMYEELMTSNTKILFNEKTAASSKIDYANQYAGQLIEESSIEIAAEDVIKTGSITVLDDGNYIHFQNEELDHMKLSRNGIALSYKMAQNLGVEVGDFIKWHMIGDERWVMTRIEQLYRSPSNQGISMNRETFEKLEYAFEPTALLTNQTPQNNLADKDDIQGIQNISQLKEDMDETMEMMNIMVGILIAAAVVLGIVVLYNLGVLTFVEKTREIATLKVLGFSSRKIRGILQAQNVWVTVAGILIGMPIGYQFLAVLCSTLSEAQDMVPVVSALSYAYSMLGTFLVSMLVNALLSGKVKTIDMVDALKGVE
ncbi:ABC transporter permease [Konateibacter massiliensis]|uniref:ABC transporter permease n=1 Tax=Konateibacter massiliensis TaxID=2002841 RepID=UPI000C14FF81|nr:ABC transporter permease [Konateibacter massiliensis]